jgi:hypothetical protein
MFALSVVASPAFVGAKATDYKAGIDVRPADGKEIKNLVGFVFEDLNRDGKYQKKHEPGIPDVMVSDGNNVVLTDAQGMYQLPLPNAEDEARGITIFVTKPAGYEVPVDRDNVPQFSYVHKPDGSPLNVRGEPFRFGGLDPTGPLPWRINFPLIKGENKYRFKIVVSGDTQAYSNTELGYLRDTLARELAGMKDELEAVIIEGDVMGDDLSLYPRFKQIMSVAGSPQYYVPGNHDLDFDAATDAHSFDTFRREWGPEYYSFDIGDVHFVVLDDVKYPCTPDEDNLDGLHGDGNQCDTPDTNPTYNGVLTQRHLSWLRNDLALVPKDKLIVFNMHIPIYAFINQNFARQMMDNVRELYEILGCPIAKDGDDVLAGCERPVLALSGHTHTNEQIRPGETFEGWDATLDSGKLPPGRAVGASPCPQIIVGAAAGSWWSGDFSAAGVPESWQRLGAPRGYYIFEFEGNTYKDTFKATGKPIEQQMSVDLLTPAFREWFKTLSEWRKTNPAADAKPPVNINDLPDTKLVPKAELGETSLSVNVWNGSRDSVVYVQFDDRFPIFMERVQRGEGENMLETLDPFALKRQMQIARHALVSGSGNPRVQSFELFRGENRCPAPDLEGDPRRCTPRPDDPFFWTVQSNHIWQVKLPDDLAVGMHMAKVGTRDVHGKRYEDILTFEVVEQRLDQETEALFQSDFFEVLP